MSHRSGSRALQPKIPKTDFKEIRSKIDKKELLDELYECDENYIDGKLCILKNKNVLKYDKVQITQEEKTEIFDKKTDELLQLISTAVEILYKKRSFDLDKRNHYLSSSNNFTYNFQSLIHYLKVTTLEMIEGILKNGDSDNQSLLFIRDLICIDEKMRKEKDVFYNKKESDNLDLNALKEKTVKKLPKDNFFQLTVINF